MEQALAGQGVGSTAVTLEGEFASCGGPVVEWP